MICMHVIFGCFVLFNACFLDCLLILASFGASGSRPLISLSSSHYFYGK